MSPDNNLDLTCNERPSDSPFVETVWSSQSEQAAPFISMADHSNALVITKYRGKTVLTVRGPETRATPANMQSDSEFWGIRFKPGVFMPYFPARMVMDRHDLNLPEAGDATFWLNGSAWEIPDFENADTFVDWLARDGLLVYDPIVEAALRGEPLHLSPRQAQRRFLQSTGLTYKTMSQIQRARFAVRLLKQGAPAAKVAYQAGYFDQPHLIRSLKHFVGLTPGEIHDSKRSKRMSFLYNTASPLPATMSGQEDNDESNNPIRVLDSGWQLGSAERPSYTAPE